MRSCKTKKPNPHTFGKCAEEGRIKTTYVFRAHGSLLLIMFKCLRYVQEQQVSHGAKVTTIKGWVITIRISWSVKTQSLIISIKRTLDFFIVYFLFFFFYRSFTLLLMIRTLKVMICYSHNLEVFNNTQKVVQVRLRIF